MYDKSLGAQLQHECLIGGTEEVRELIKNRADVNARAKGDTDAGVSNPPIVLATSQGHIEIVELLLNAGAEPNLKMYGENGNTALISAVTSGHLGIVKMLVEFGADPDIAGNDKISARSFAEIRGDPEIIAALSNQQFFRVAPEFSNRGRVIPQLPTSLLHPWITDVIAAPHKIHEIEINLYSFPDYYNYIVNEMQKRLNLEQGRANYVFDRHVRVRCLNCSYKLSQEDLAISVTAANSSGVPSDILSISEADVRLTRGDCPGLIQTEFGGNLKASYCSAEHHHMEWVPLPHTPQRLPGQTLGVDESEKNSNANKDQDETNDHFTSSPPPRTKSEWMKVYGFEAVGYHLAQQKGAIDKGYAQRLYDSAYQLFHTSGSLPLNNLETAATHNSLDAQLFLAELYDVGRHVERDPGKAAKWSEVAAKRGNSTAQYRLGLLYLLGRGVRKNFQEAKNWLLHAAIQDDANAQYSLGYGYISFHDTEDYVRAAPWFSRASAQGYGDAQLALGALYERGLGVTQNQDQALRYYTRSAARDNPQACVSLGVHYLNTPGIQKNETMAAALFRRAAMQGSPAGQNCMGVCYQNGHGVERNISEAVEWYKKSAEQRFDVGQYNLALCYKNGRGVPQNRLEALKLFRLAAEQGHTLAQEQITDLDGHS